MEDRTTMGVRAVSPRVVGVLAALSASTLFSVGGIGVKLADVEPLAIAGYRSSFALVVLALVARLMRGGGGASSGSRMRGWVATIAISYAATLITFVLATRLTTAANAILLQFTAPLYVALFSRFVLNERVSFADAIAVLGALLGLTIFLGGDLGGGDPLGNAIGAFSGFCFAVFTLAMRRFRLDEAHASAPLRDTAIAKSGMSSALRPVVLGNAVAAFVCVPWMIASPPPSFASWLLLFGLGAVQIGVAYALYVFAVGRLTAIEMMLFGMLEPLLNPIWVLLGTHERPTPGALIGGTLILGSLVLRTVLLARKDSVERLLRRRSGSLGLNR